MTDPLNTPTLMLARGLKLSSGGTPKVRRFKLNPIMEDENAMQPCSPGKFGARQRLPLEEHDPNSQDSGIDEPSKSDFRFATPLGAAPRRCSDLSAMDVSPSASQSPSPLRRMSSPGFRLISPKRCLKSPRRALFSQASSDSAFSLDEDDPFNEAFPPGDEEAQGGSLGGLISAKIMSPPKSPHRPSLYRAHSMIENKRSRETPVKEERGDLLEDYETPVVKKLRCITAEEENTSFKKGTLFQYGFKSYPSPPLSTPSPQADFPQMLSPVKSASQPLPARHTSPDIKQRLHRSTQEELIGDMSRPFALPLVSCQHNDLKAISALTLAQLVRGGFDSVIDSYRVIDCRYPYEYKAGHIVGAENLYTRDQISSQLFSEPGPNSAGTHVLVFHCEFSSERGPCLYRWLRKIDRARNPYPSLKFPEIYLLDGGYKEFFRCFSELCQPRSYVPMEHPGHTDELKHFRNKSKSWAGHNHKKITNKNLSRLLLSPQEPT